MDNSLAHTLLIRFAGNIIRLTMNHTGLFAILQTHFKHCLGEAGESIAAYKIITTNENEFSISCNGDELFSKLNLEQVLFQLMQAGLTQLNGASVRELVFHTAALAFQDHGLLLCGKSGSGKSTLTAWLVASGFQYLSDEVISYPLAGGVVNGFCRSLVLKNGSAFLWERWLPQTEANGFLKMDDGSAWIEPTLLNPAAVRVQVEPRVILFPTYSAGAEFNAEPLSRANTLFLLMQCLVNARNFADHGIERTKQLAQKVSAYRLTYSDIEQAAQWIQKTMTA